MGVERGAQIADRMKRLGKQTPPSGRRRPGSSRRSKRGQVASAWRGRLALHCCCTSRCLIVLSIVLNSMRPQQRTVFL